VTTLKSALVGLGTAEGIAKLGLLATMMVPASLAGPVMMIVLTSLVGLGIAEGLIITETVAGLGTDGSILARLPVESPFSEDAALYAVAMVVLVTTAVKIATVGGAAVPIAGVFEEGGPLPPSKLQPDEVKLAQVRLVLFAKVTTRLRLPMKAGVSGWRER